jgi:hypothetical protein
VEYDDHASAPWEDCDGYEHEAIWRHQSNFPEYYNRDHIACNGRDSCLIRVELSQVREWMGEYSPFSGEHIQHYHERIAAERQWTIKLLVEWYQGWIAYGVICEYADEDASLWGIYADFEEDEHVQSCRKEIAEELAYALQKKGWTVTGLPGHSRKRDRANRRRAWLRMYTHRLGFESTEKYREWLAKGPIP